MNPPENNSPTTAPVPPSAAPVPPPVPAPAYRRGGAFFLSDLEDAISQIESCAEGHDPDQFYPALIKMLKEKVP